MDALTTQIIELYKEHYSVSEVLRQITASGQYTNRNRIEKVLKTAGIYEGINGENYLRKHQNRVKAVIKEKYGVENYGTISRGFGDSNKIPYRKVTFLTDGFQEYRLAVERLTVRNLKKVPMPAYCEYTGIKFADEDGKANPNDPRKRSVDHKIPIVVCYLQGVSIKDAAAIENTAFVLRYVNTIKANTAYDSFVPLAQKIREAFINEGFESN